MVPGRGSWLGGAAGGEVLGLGGFWGLEGWEDLAAWRGWCPGEAGGLKGPVGWKVLGLGGFWGMEGWEDLAAWRFKGLGTEAGGLLESGGRFRDGQMIAEVGRAGTNRRGGRWTWEAMGCREIGGGGFRSCGGMMRMIEGWITGALNRP